MARIWMIWLAVMMLAVSAFAQDGNYRLRQEDVLRISVYNEQQIQALVTVGRDGNITAPFVGNVRAEGRTVGELEADLAALYERVLKLRDPKVSVTIERFRTYRASVTGAVNRPGAYELRPGDTLVALLSYGGGYIFDRADTRRVILRRAGTKESIPIDLHSLLKGDTSQNYEIQDGDELIVPENTRNTVTVQGAVAAPNQFVWREGMRLSDALALARGDIPIRSKKSGIVIFRERAGIQGQYVAIRADYIRFETKADWSQNVVLMPGDIVHVPYTKTPNIQEIGSIVNNLLFLDEFTRRGLFGFRFFR
jgi:polysaccharide export outer membrane protein